jgi:hypothetical protein
LPFAVLQACTTSYQARTNPNLEMKMLVTKTALAASVGLASLIGAGAAAAQAQQQAAPQTYDDEGNQRSVGFRRWWRARP